MTHNKNNKGSQFDQARRRTLGMIAMAPATGSLLPSLAFGQSSRLEVETAYGKVRGFVDDGVYHFLGVRYGAPAGGERRFKAPDAPAPWSGVVDAIAYGNTAMQSNPDSANSAAASPKENEDCLFLNVYTSSPSPERNRPVMVWLHGGAFSSGSASDANVQGANLVRRGDAVVVGVNHRLNAFGYTHLAQFGGDELAHSGNAGMLDIVFALEWVRDNIERFGGDPKRVMVFGESGGGQKVSTLMASPLAQGLYTRAAIQSGPGVEMVEETRAHETGEIFLSELGLTRSTFSDIYRLPGEAILRANFSTLAKRGGIVAGFVSDFGPVIDGYYMHGNPFSDATVSVSADVPLILGWNRTEMTLFAQGDDSAFKLDDAGMRRRVVALHGEEVAAQIIEVYRSKYPEASPTRLYFLIWSDYPTMLWSNYIASQRHKQNAAATWLYRFDWETPIQGGRLMTPHALDVPFVFDNIAFAEGSAGSNPNAFAMAGKMSTAWLNLAETGNPNTPTRLLPQWEAFTATGRETLIINDESRLVQDPMAEELQVLQQVFPLA